MPKGKKRTHADYEREIDDAIKRFKKYPERKIASKDSESWIDFLSGIGINQDSINSGGDFWERVRIGTELEVNRINYNVPTSYVYKKYENRNIFIEMYEDTTYYKEIYTDDKIIYRDTRTGRFTKKHE